MSAPHNNKPCSRPEVLVSSSIKYREVRPHIGPKSPLITIVSRQTQLSTGWSGELRSNLPSVRHAISAVLSVYDLDTHRSLNHAFRQFSFKRTSRNPTFAILTPHYFSFVPDHHFLVNCHHLHLWEFQGKAEIRFVHEDAIIANMVINPCDPTIPPDQRITEGGNR